MRPVLMPVLLALILACFVSAARAGDPAMGPRIGLTHDGDLDQLHVGGHVTVSRISPNIHVTPSFEIGFGDGTLLALNGDVVYELSELARGRWSYYAGGGPLLSHCYRQKHRSTDFALSLVAGVMRELTPRRTVFGEVRIGLEDAPLLKITAGMTFF
jgi:predicted protein tyrosine phosphatase